MGAPFNGFIELAGALSALPPKVNFINRTNRIRYPIGGIFNCEYKDFVPPLMDGPLSQI
jgi:hypothetical protein